jgi:hypothetical protein
MTDATATDQASAFLGEDEPSAPALPPVPALPPTHIVFNESARVVGRFSDAIEAHRCMRHNPGTVGTMRLPRGVVTGFMAPFNMSVRRAQARAEMLAIVTLRRLIDV